MLKPLFELGRTISTPAALEVMAKAGVDPHSLLVRHSQLDPGRLDKEDQQRNREALRDGWRIFSSFEVGSERVWVITEHDRSLTTILLRSEY